jgi:PAS domain S-box-containing protein
MIPRLLRAGKPAILLSTAALVLLVTLADRASGNNISLAALYILPMMLGAVVLRPAETALFALLCSYLRSWFDIEGTPLDLALRFVFAALAYLVSGLFVTALLRNRELAIQHLGQIQKEQALRREAEEHLRVLAESSPAAILTVDGDGAVLAANESANRLFMLPSSETLEGRQIVKHLPFLADVLRVDAQSIGLRTAVKCQGQRANGEIFLAHMWLSAYRAGENKRLAAIIVDSSEDLRDREEQGLQQLLTGNQIATAAVAHEVRNACQAMAMLCEDLRQRHPLSEDTALRGLDSLVGGLEAIASFELQAKSHEVEAVSLKEVLDTLRIVIEPAWREIEGAVRFHLPAMMPHVCSEPYGLLQSFLNLAQNSHRAVQEGPVRELDIAVSLQDPKVIVTFQDSGPGVAAPEDLFRPFQQGAAGSGLGLYVSRFLVRSYGGELRFEPSSHGCCFAIELDSVPAGELV